ADGLLPRISAVAHGQRMEEAGREARCTMDSRRENLRRECEGTRGGERQASLGSRSAAKRGERAGEPASAQREAASPPSIDPPDGLHPNTGACRGQARSGEDSMERSVRALPVLLDLVGVDAHLAQARRDLLWRE